MGSRDAELLDEGLIMIEKGAGGTPPQGTGIEVIRRYGRGELGGEVLTGVLRRAFREGNRLEAARTALVDELDRIEQARADGPGERSVPAWLHWEAHLTENAAHGQVRLARQLTGLPATAAAFQQGAISDQHVLQIARAVEREEHWGSGQCADSAEALLVEQARNCDPFELSNWAKDLRHRLAPEDLAAEEGERRRWRYLSLRRRCRPPRPAPRAWSSRPNGAASHNNPAPTNAGRPSGTSAAPTRSDPQACQTHAPRQPG